MSEKIKPQPPTYPTDASHSDDFDFRNTRRAHARRAAPIRWQLVLGALFIFGVTFFLATRSLIRLQPRESLAEQIPALEVNEGQQSGSRGSAEGNEVL